MNMCSFNFARDMTIWAGSSLFMAVHTKNPGNPVKRAHPDNYWSVELDVANKKDQSLDFIGANKRRFTEFHHLTDRNDYSNFLPNVAVSVSGTISIYTSINTSILADVLFCFCKKKNPED
jgi:hypothetical protein